MARSVTLHGGSLDLMQGTFPNAPQPWIDLSTGINPWPYPDTEIAASELQHLPTARATTACRRAMALAIGAASENLLLAPGSELLIRLLPTVLNPTRVCVAAGSYGDHAKVWGASGTEMQEHADPLQHVDDYDTLVVVNPNNPDGRRWSRDQMLAVARKLGRKGGHLIVDEAYADLEPQHSLADACGINGLIVLRSFGKFYGLAGVRLGALLAPDDLLTAMSTRLGVWPVSGLALSIATRAYADAGWQTKTRDRLRHARAALDTVIAHRKIDIVGGTDLFRLVTVRDSRQVWQTLAGAGIYARHFDWNPHYLRIGIPGNAEKLDRLDRALALVSP